MSSNQRSHLNYTNAAAFILMAALGSACTPNGSLTSSTGSSSSSTVVSTTTTSSGPTINSFSPAGGSVTSMPTTVQVQFSETTLTTSTVTNTSNWNYICSNTSTTYYPSSVTLASGIATITLPSVALNQGTSCTLTASSNITDTSGYALYGTVAATYQAQNDGVTFIGSFPNINLNDRLYQYSSAPYQFVVDIYPSTFLYNSVSIKNVQFLINNIPIGYSDQTIGTNSYSLSYGEFTLTQDLTKLASFFTGKVTLSVNVIDSNGIMSTPIATNIIISKNAAPSSASWSSYDYATNGVGNSGSGGSNDSLQGYLLYGFSYSVDALVDGIQSMYKAANTGVSGPTSILGNTYGTFNSYHTVSCITDLGANYRAVGVFGRVDGNRFNDINELGLDCQDVTNPGSAIRQTSSQVAGTDGIITTFDLECPAGSFVVQVGVVYGSWLDRIRINCQ